MCRSFAHQTLPMPSAADTKSALASLFQTAVQSAFPELGECSIVVERPKNPEHGHYAVNSALQLAKRLGKKPRDIADAMVKAIPANDLIASVDIAGPGFVNIRLSAAAETAVVNRIFAQGGMFGRGSAHMGKKIMVEFVSANPTGPLHVGHGRQAALGDSICRVLQSQGWEVLREFYYNDAGNQINTLALSTQARIRELNGAPLALPADGYHGEYIVDIARDYVAANPDDAKGEDLDGIRRFAVKYLRAEQDRDLQAFDVKFDNFFLESSLYTDGKVDEVVRLLLASGKTFEEGGALWLRTTELGDDKDRVMRKSDGSYTYFLPDVAYHLDKFRRGYANAVNVQGSDHHSTVARVRAGLQFLGQGIPQGYPDYALHQMVLVMRGGEEVKLSKRAGDYVTLRDLIDEVGKDAVRYFLVMRKVDSQLTFDIELAKRQSEDNPVYYVQYAHARICSVLNQWGGEPALLANTDLAPLTSPYESALLRALADFPELLADAAQEFAPHLVTFYLSDLAAKLHTYYNAEHFLVEDEKLKLARLALITATRQVLRNGLAVVGVSAPEKM
jgi:arginyl-tRNA synthetase